MSEHNRMKHGALSVTRRINAPPELVYEAWTQQARGLRDPSGE
jgi:uncharacterized protein YndB with AHSA1/START domain